MKRFIFVPAVLFLLSGCAQKMQVRVLQPAEVASASKVKKIAVSEFKNDRVNLSSKIEAKLFEYKLDDKPYFNVVSRQDLDKVLEEQKMQNSGIFDPSTVVEVGNLTGADAIIAGDVSSPSHEDTNFFETRTKCDKEKCWEIKVGCLKRVFSLTSEVRLIDAKKGDVIFADTVTKNSSYKHCSDDSNALFSQNMAAQVLAEEIADSFVYKLLPHYAYFSVELLDEGDIEYSDAQKKLLKSALLYIEQNRLDKAESLLLELIDWTAQKSYVPIYDLGVIKEAQGKLQEAKELYYKADSITREPVRELNDAINRINRVIEQNTQALNQINNR